MLCILISLSEGTIICDFISWGVMLKDKNGFKEGDVLFLDDEQMAHLKDYGESDYGRYFSDDDVFGHHAIAAYYRLSPDDFSHEEGLIGFPPSLLAAIEDGRLNKAKAAHVPHIGSNHALIGDHCECVELPKLDKPGLHIEVKGKDINRFLSNLAKRGIRWASNDPLFAPDSKTPKLCYWHDICDEDTHEFCIDPVDGRLALTNGYSNKSLSSQAFYAKLDQYLKLQAKLNAEYEANLASA